MKSLSQQLAALGGHNRMGLITVIAVANAIAADARFNIWFLDNVKNSGQPEDTVLKKMEEAGALEEMCEAAINNFQQRGTLEELDAALKKFSSDITAAMKI